MLHRIDFKAIDNPLIAALKKVDGDNDQDKGYLPYPSQHMVFQLN